jgi:hypothetical protein
MSTLLFLSGIGLLRFPEKAFVESSRLLLLDHGAQVSNSTDSLQNDGLGSAVPCYKIPEFSPEGINPVQVVGTILRTTFIPLVKDAGDHMTLSCLREWESNDGRCVWIPGFQGRKTAGGSFRPGCQPNCLHLSSQQSELHCVDPDQRGEQQLCEWISGVGCIYNKVTEQAEMTWHDLVNAQTQYFEYWNADRSGRPGITPWDVRDYYCDAKNWNTKPTPWNPATPLSNAGQVKFCYGVGTVFPESFDRSTPTKVNICPKKETLQYLLTDHHLKPFGGGGSGAKVWGVMCEQPHRASTCQYVLKALTIKEAMVVHSTEHAGDPVHTLLMPTCAWWIPGMAPVFNMRASDFSALFSPLSNESIKTGNDGGRVWILMPNMAHASFLPGELVGAPIDVKGWSATTGKLLTPLTIFGKTNETQFKQDYSRFDITLHTPAGKGQWPEKLSRSLKLLVEHSLSDYSLFFAITRIPDQGSCRNRFNWPQLILADWMPDKKTSEKLCVAVSIIDFTKEESDFGIMDAKQTNAIKYAQNMLGMFVDSNPSNRLVKLSESTFDELLQTQQTLVKG